MKVSNVNGLRTLFYDGSVIVNDVLEREWNHYHESVNMMRRIREQAGEGLSEACINYWNERQSWEQIIVIEGVIEIPRETFSRCKNIKRVIFADTVIQIKELAFDRCYSLVYIKLSLRLESIGPCAFNGCNISSVFIPPTCKKIGNFAFLRNKNLTIFNVSSSYTQLGLSVIAGSNLIQDSSIDTNELGYYRNQTEEANAWIKNLNNSDEFKLHRICSSIDPQMNEIYGIFQQIGMKAFQTKNEAGITPSEYLKENPHITVTEKEVLRYCILKMMGEMK